jgi:sec-independent protein translocase protein TatA
MYDNVTLNYAFGMPGIGELVIIFLIILVLFGASKIPSIAKDIGTGIKEFKKSVKDAPEDDDKK